MVISIVMLVYQRVSNMNSTFWGKVLLLHLAAQSPSLDENFSFTFLKSWLWSNSLYTRRWWLNLTYTMVPPIDIFWTLRIFDRGRQQSTKQTWSTVHILYSSIFIVHLYNSIYSSIYQDFFLALGRPFGASPSFCEWRSLTWKCQ